MFESAELGHTLPQKAYDAAVPALREALLDAQNALRTSRAFSAVILVAGVEGAGKGETVHTLHEWMDPRHLVTHAFAAEGHDDEKRPDMARFLQALPPRGTVGVLFGSWYTAPIVAHAAGHRRTGKKGDQALEEAVERIRRLETYLVREGVLLLKVWFHLSKKAQKARLRELEADPATRFRVTKEDWRRFARYDAFRATSERVLRATDTGEAPWTIVEGTCPRFREVTVGETLLRALRRRLDGDAPAAGVVPAAPAPPRDGVRILDALPFEERLSKEKYGPLLAKRQRTLTLLLRKKAFRERSLVAVFEGNDAAGKGGAIRRVVQPLDPRAYRIVPVAAPSDEDKLYPYLWRFAGKLPKPGGFTLFDRSWYGRVLVERVEGFCEEADWRRAYGEIVDFERDLERAGGIVTKQWLAVTKGEQLRRFREREKLPYKQYKITPDDWRNRKRWDDYLTAASDMIERTSTPSAPWVVVEADDKHLARIRSLEALIAALERAL